MWKHALLIPLAFAVVAAGNVVYLTADLPFVWEDLRWIGHASFDADTLRACLPWETTGSGGFADRPVERLSLGAVRAVAGQQSALPYYVLKAAFLAGLVFLATWWSWCLQRNWLATCLTGLLLALGYPLIASSVWICDFDVPAQLIALAAMIGLFQLESGGDRSRGRWVALLSAVVLAAALASKTKGTAKSVPLVAIVLFGLHLARTRTLDVRRLAGAVLLTAVVFLPNLLAPTAYPYGPSAAVAGGLLALLAESLTLPLALVLAAALLYCVFKRRSSVATFFFAWTAVAMASWWLYPFPEVRYVGAAYIPFVLGGVHCAAQLCGSVIRRPLVRWCLLALLLLVFAGNAVRKQIRWRLDLRLHRAQAQAVEVLESRGVRGPLVYRYWRDLGLPWKTGVEILAISEPLKHVRGPLPGQVPAGGCWVLSQFPPKDGKFETVTPASERLIDKLGDALYPQAPFSGAFHLYEIAR
ncbi:MAG: hypothetical protein O7C98_06935 [Planctomycetota bacterium]|nr:hypothetical protein [Planctomycetota bacterium]